MIEQEKNLFEIIKIILRGKKIIAASTLIVSVFSILLSLYLPNIYQSTTLVAPIDESANTQISGLSKSLASFAGADVNSGSVSKIDIVLATLQSRKFILDFIKRRDIKVPLMAGKKWDKNTRTLIIDEDLYNTQKKIWTTLGNKESTPELTYLKFKKNLSVIVNAKTGMININFKFLSPNLTYRWVTWLIHDINEYQRIQDINKTNEKVIYLQHQTTQTNISEIKNILYELIKEQYKIRLLANTREEYFLATIDPAIEPEFAVSPKRVLIWIVGTLFGGFIGFLIVYGRHLYVTHRG